MGFYDDIDTNTDFRKEPHKYRVFEVSKGF